MVSSNSYDLICTVQPLPGRPGENRGSKEPQLLGLRGEHPPAVRVGQVDECPGAVPGGQGFQVDHAIFCDHILHVRKVGTIRLLGAPSEPTPTVEEKARKDLPPLASWAPRT